MLTNLLSSRALGLAVLLLTGAAGMHAAKDEFERSKPHVNVMSAGHVVLRDPAIEFDFSMQIAIEPDGSASGGMNFLLLDGSVRHYRPVAGTLLEGRECLVFFLGGLPNGQLDPNDFAIAFVRPGPAPRGTLVIFQSPQLYPFALEFDIPGEISATPSSREPREPRAHPWFNFHYRPQSVIIHGTNLAIGFAASLHARRDHSAHGRIVIDPRDGLPPISFEPLFGTRVPEAATGPGYIVILMALSGAPLRMENLAVGVVHPDAHLPGCDIWEFSSNGVPPGRSPLPRLTFHAEGAIHIVPGGR